MLMNSCVVLFNAVVIAVVLCLVLLAELSPEILSFGSSPPSLAEKAARSVMLEVAEVDHGSLAMGNIHMRTGKRRLQEPSAGLPHNGGYHTNHSTTAHKHAWMHYEVVDGLKNEEVVMFVMSSTTREGYLLRERYVFISQRLSRTKLLILTFCSE